jgi:hypothetical protein
MLFLFFMRGVNLQHLTRKFCLPIFTKFIAVLNVFCGKKSGRTGGV